MKSRKITTKKIIVYSIAFFAILSSCSIGTFGEYQTLERSKSSQTTDNIPYTGNLRVYVVEPWSRWNMYNNRPYHFGFLDFAINEQLSIEYLDTYTVSTTWNATEAGFDFIDEFNIMVIAVVFNPESHKKYAYPPMRNPFYAHYVDATAAATPGETGSNTVTEEFTHTVFVEEGTATWCPYCPFMAEALRDVYESEDYPFYFVALIQDKNTVATQRLSEYNLYAFPTAFFDGGKKVLVGGYDEESYYRSKIEQCGATDVHELDLTVSMNWLGNGLIQVTVNITNLEEIPNEAPNAPSITGPSDGKAGEEQSYTLETTDPNENDVYYYIDWGDDTVDEWIGPYDSGEEITVKHTWMEKGTYTIKVKAKDEYNEESDWTTLEVSMPLLMTVVTSDQQQNDKNRDHKSSQTIIDNTPPNPPEILGPTSGKILQTYGYSFILTDPDGDDLLRLEIDFGDETYKSKCGCDKPWYNGTIVNISHRWTDSGTYNVTARVQDENGEWSEWAEPLPVTMPKLRLPLFLLRFFEQLNNLLSLTPHSIP